jgi:hypothetical protein
MRSTIAIIVLALMQTLFFAITYCQNPTDGFASYYFAWVLVPATVAALAFTPRFHFVGAISNAIVSSLLFDYLFLQHGYFWPERPKESMNLAIGYVVNGAGLAFIVAGFVHSIIKQIERARPDKVSARMVIAMRKGFVFSLICAAVAFPLCTMFGPVGTGVQSNPIYAFATIFAASVVLTGTLLSVAVGLSYDPTKFEQNA